MHQIVQTLAPQMLITKVVSYFANSKLFARPFIKWFSKRYQVNLHEAKESNVRAYKTFNDFFTRRLREDARPIDARVASVISPADGVLSQWGTITNGRVIQAKGQTFSVNEFLAGDANSEFDNGQFFTIYLSPRDYHRVHFPFDCVVEKMIYIPGKLFSVSPKTAECIPNLFARNERLCVFVKTDFGPAVIVLIGAMIVAGIHVNWHGDVSREKKVREWCYSKEASLSFKKGSELGHFKLGSTVVVLTAEAAVNFSEQLSAACPIKMGQSIAMLMGK